MRVINWGRLLGAGTNSNMQQTYTAHTVAMKPFVMRIIIIADFVMTPSRIGSWPIYAYE